MPERKRLLLLLIPLLIITACDQKEKPGLVVRQGREVKYAEHFELQQEEQYSILCLKGRRNPEDTTAVFILYKEQAPELNFKATTYKIKIPCQKIVALSSIYASMFAELGTVDRLSAIDNIDYVCHPLLLQKFKEGNLSETGKGPEPDWEKILTLQPDILLMFGMGNPEAETKAPLKRSGIPYAQVVDHLEKNPLARAEWIRFFAAFADKGRLADSLFAEVEKAYLQLRDSVATITTKPLVLTELKYGETWYVPGGQSFMAALLKDAGALYPWSEVPQSGSLPLSFEEVYLKAGQADLWINLSMVRDKTEMLQQDARYAEFKAFQLGQLYNNNKRVNAKGYSEYWENAMYHPERLLRDLVNIFHHKTPEEKELYYYRKIN